jgi:Flp pilus assembly protein TadG
MGRYSRQIGCHPAIRLARDARAVAAIEFALSLTPLLLLAFGFIATSVVFFAWSTMQSRAEYAARLMSTGQVTSLSTGTISSTNTTATTDCGSSLTSSDVEYYACSGLPSWVPVTVTATEDCTVPSVSVRLSASAATAALADTFGFFTGKQLVATAVLMKEGQCP